jgi:hypothetical protein
VRECSARKAGGGGGRRNNAPLHKNYIVHLINAIIDKPLNKFNQNPQGQKLIQCNRVISHASVYADIRLDVFVQCSLLQRIDSVTLYNNKQLQQEDARSFPRNL